MNTLTDTEIRKLAEAHVEWLIDLLIPIIRRIGIEEFTHGYKHCKEDMSQPPHSLLWGMKEPSPTRAEGDNI